MSSHKVKWITLTILIVISFQFSPIANSTPAGDNIIITEVLYDAPSSDATEEWFELYNPTDNAYDLVACKMGDNYANISLSGIIPAKSYFVVAKNAIAFDALYGYIPQLVLDWGSFALSNSGDWLTLYDAGDNIVDFVAWENKVAGWSVTADDGETIRRINVVDTDTNADWENSGTLGDPGSGPYDIVDDTLPTVEILTPLNDSTVSRFVEITINATDENGIASYAIYIDGLLESTASTYMWDSRNVNNGSHEISARARDSFNNVGEHNITVIVDNDDLIFDLDLIKVMTYNVQESGIVDPDWKEVVKEENPDIVVFVETGYWDDNLDEDLKAYTDEFNAYFVDEEPYESYTAQGISYSTSGEAIMSRFPILESVQIPEVPLDNGTMYDVTHDFMFWNVNISGLEVYIIGAHLKAMGGAENEIRREYETEGIINYMDALGDHPILYMGDLNSFSPEDTGALAPDGDLGYGPLTMMLVPDDPTYGQYSSEVHNFTDIYRTLNPTTPGYTYQGIDSRIDFIIANDYFVDYLINSTVGDTASAYIASDHNSVDFFFDAYSMVNELDIAPPAEVQGLTADWVATNQINLIWDANSESDLDYYRVYRDGVNIANTTNTYYNDMGLSPSTWYDYEVTAVDTSGNEGVPSDTVSVRTYDVIPEFPVFGVTLLVLLGMSALVSIFIYRRK